MNQWKIKEEGFDRARIELNGSRFTIGNGYFGYRGTLDEFGKEQLCAFTMAGIYDDANGWREIVNGPNPLYTRVYYGEEELSAISSKVIAHEMELDIQTGLLWRRTTYEATDGNEVTFYSERVAGCKDRNLLLAKYKITVKNPGMVVVKTGFDKEIWECNGPHFERLDFGCNENLLIADGKTKELNKSITIATLVNTDKGEWETKEDETSLSNVCSITLEAGEEGIISKYVSVWKEDRVEACQKHLHDCVEQGYEELLRQIVVEKEEMWAQVDIVIEGDEAAQRALRHNIYLLLTAAPFGEEAMAIPARGLSGQVYKGAMFWDTELYMLPMFMYEFPEVARSLVMYRIRNLEPALRKAEEYGFYGAFFPWESQETGQEGCTHYNLTDIFTGRKVRTYFRDKQIHISADVAYGIWKYYETTSDISLLKEGGVRTMLECSRFFCSWAYYKKDKGRYEFLDVTGADEYHERVNNNFYTNAMIQYCLEKTLEAVEVLRKEAPKAFGKLEELPWFEDALEEIRDMKEKIYIAAPNERGVIEQFDGFFKLEDVSVEEIKSRIMEPNEYLGSPTGLCVETQIGKQADVVLLLSTLQERYSTERKRENFRYYEPRTEHGSSLSTCIYALLAAQTGDVEWAYKYFMKTALLDMNGDYKLYLGPLYIGGTHPAANGGAWRIVAEGFAGLQVVKGVIQLAPHMPEHWKSMKFRIKLENQGFTISIMEHEYSVTADKENQKTYRLKAEQREIFVKPGETIVQEY